MTVPRVVSDEDAVESAYWRDHHHAPTADPITLARIP
jgi:hypothetical protein